MTADPRAVEIIAAALCLWRDHGDCAFRDKHQPEAKRVLAALATAGWSLLPPGGQTEIHWAVIGEDDSGEWIECEDDEAEARRLWARLHAEDSTARVVFRTEHTTSWQPADTPGEPA